MELNWIGEIQKVDTEQRLVYGRAMQEGVDLQDDLIKADVARNAFDEYAKSSGAVREMHDPHKAVGRLQEWKPVDKAIDVCVYLSKSRDGEDALTKVSEGVLRGFSIGGKADDWDTTYVEGRQVRVLKNIKIRELSLVDVPANPNAKITLWKADMEPIDVKVEDETAQKYAEPTSPRTITADPALGGGGEVPFGETLAQENHQPTKDMQPMADTPRPTESVPQSSVGEPQSAPAEETSVQVSKAVCPHCSSETETTENETKCNKCGKVSKTQKDGTLTKMSDEKRLKQIGIREKNPGVIFKGVDRSEYADPLNWSWPCHTANLCLTNLYNYNLQKGKENYSEREWAILGRRLTRMISKSGKYRFNPREKQIERVEIKEASMDSKLSKGDLLAAARGMAETARAAMEAGDKEAAFSALDQMSATLDVASDATSVETGPAPTTPTATSTVGTSTATKTATTVEMADKPSSSSKDEETTETSEEESVTKQVFATTPPVAPDVIIKSDLAEQRLPEFMNALETLPGKFAMRKAQELADHDSEFFDEMFHKASRKLLTEGGWLSKNLGEINSLANKSLGSENNNLQKGISSTTMPGYYLQRLVKLMLPVVTPLRHRFPATTPPVGATAAHWKVELGYPSISQAQLLYNVAEAGVTLSSTTGTGQTVNETIDDYAADYKRIALNDIVSLEAVYSARGYDDPLQVAVIRALTILLGAEERKILGDNQAVIGRPASATAVGAGSGTVGNSGDVFEVSALTYIGYLNSATGGATTVQGESNVRAASSVNLSGAASVTVTWPIVKGAVAYNVYYNPSGGGNHYYVGTYTANTTGALTALPTAGNAGPTSDGTANSNGFEGLVSWCERSTIYGNSVPSKTVTDNAGAALTLVAPNSISQFDTILSALWTNWNITPTAIVCSPTSALHAAKIIGSSSNPALRVNVASGPQQAGIVGGVMATAYANKFAWNEQGGQPLVDIIGHPYMVDGTYLFLSESIRYPMAREARAFALDVQIPYTYFPLAQTTFAYPFGMIVKETLQCFHPSAQAAIQGVAVS